MGVETLRESSKSLKALGSIDKMSEVLIPRFARAEIIRTLHISHPATETMLNQTKNKIFWPKMREELQKFYETCEACTALYTVILGSKRAMRYQWGAYLTTSI